MTNPHGACYHQTRAKKAFITTIFQRPRINHQITAPEVRVIGESGENLGVMAKDKALALADPARGIDLIEIVPTATPPVVRLMSFDKYRYEIERQAKKERRAQKGTELKQVQISARAAQNDLLTKARQADKFLKEGHPVEIRVRLRGRENALKDWARKKLDEFLGMVTEEHKLMGEPKFGSRVLTVQLVKK